jgi:hypothetical protein
MWKTLSPYRCKVASFQKLLCYYSVDYWKCISLHPLPHLGYCLWLASFLVCCRNSLCRILTRKQSNKNKNQPFLEETVLHDNNGKRIPKSNMSDSMLNNYLNYSVSLSDFRILEMNKGDKETYSEQTRVFSAKSAPNALRCTRILRSMWRRTKIRFPSDISGPRKQTQCLLVCLAHIPIIINGPRLRFNRYIDWVCVASTKLCL